MRGSDLSEPVRRLITECLGSAAEVEVLLLSARLAERSLSAGDVDAELRLGTERAAAALERLHRSGLLSRGDAGFRFNPRDNTRREAVRELADAYTRRRVRVIEFLYNGRGDRIALFSDAFRIRRDER